MSDQQKPSALANLMSLFVEVESHHDPMVAVLCNCSPGESPGLARALVQERLAACVNVIRGVTSYYEWQGKFEEEEEHTLLIKTSVDRYDEMKERLIELHSYDTPEVLALTVADAAQEYSKWVTEQTRSKR